MARTPDHTDATPLVSARIMRHDHGWTVSVEREDGERGPEHRIDHLPASASWDEVLDKVGPALNRLGYYYNSWIDTESGVSEATLYRRPPGAAGTTGTE